MNIITQICPVCGKDFLTKGYKRPRTYCSPRCQKQHDARTKDKPCPKCGKLMFWKSKMCANCHHAYLRSLSGSQTLNWCGGTTTDSGYKLIFLPNHPYSAATGYIREHRLVMEEKIGRYLRPEEKVHHLNGIRTDNRISNLALVSVGNHQHHTLLKLSQKHIRELEAQLSQQKLL